MRNNNNQTFNILQVKSEKNNTHQNHQSNYNNSKPLSEREINQLETSSINNIAKSYYERGFNILPLKPREKYPTIKWRKYQTERQDKKEIISQFTGSSNIGLITGEISNLLVVDLDSQSAINWYWRQFDNLPELTPIVQTSRGLHVYYKYPENLDISKLQPREDVEILGNQHLVVAPPSTHSSGKKYEYLNPLTVGLADIPEWLKSTLPKYGSVSQRAIKPHSVSSKSSKSTKNSNKSKIEINTSDLVAPQVREDITTSHEIFNHKAFTGSAKSGSCNGRYLTLLITAFNTGLEQEKAIQVTKNKYPELAESTIRDSAKAVYKNGYGLSIAKMRDIGISQPVAKDLLYEVVSLSKWRSKQSENKQLSTEQFNQKLFKGSLALTLAGINSTTYKGLANVSGISKSTLAQKDSSELPPFIKVSTQNGVGVKVYNLLPLYLAILINTISSIIAYLRTRQSSITTPLCCNGVGSSGRARERGVNSSNSQGSASINNNSPPD